MRLVLAGTRKAVEAAGEQNCTCGDANEKTEASSFLRCIAGEQKKTAIN